MLSDHQKKGNHEKFGAKRRNLWGKKEEGKRWEIVGGKKGWNQKGKGREREQDERKSIIEETAKGKEIGKKEEKKEEREVITDWKRSGKYSRGKNKGI